MDKHPNGVELLAELDLIGDLRTGGAMKREFHIEYVRDLNEADLAALATLPSTTAPRSLVRIHSSHHSLARCIASGMRPMQAALVTGYAPGTISRLMTDELFQTLVEDYRGEIKSIFADLAQRMADISLDAIEILHARLLDAPEEFTVNQLLEVVKAFADRTGHGPGQEIHHKMSVDLIDRPPRESYEDWQERRTIELKAHETKLLEKKLH